VHSGASSSPRAARTGAASSIRRALLAASIKLGETDMRTWPVSRIAEALGASKRSTFEALALSLQERDEVRNGERPLFPRRSSIPESTTTPAEYLAQAIDALGVDGVLAALVEAEATTKVAA
jgi:hypothetical protein